MVIRFKSIPKVLKRHIWNLFDREIGGDPSKLVWVKYRDPYDGKLCYTTESIVYFFHR
jgi:hypothetical protein